MRGGPLEMEQMDSPNPPVVVHCFYGDGHRQLHRPGTERRCAAPPMGDLLAPAPARVAHVHRPVHVRAAVFPQVARRAKHQLKNRTKKDNSKNTKNSTDTKKKHLERTDERHEKTHQSAEKRGRLSP